MGSIFSTPKAPKIKPYVPPIPLKTSEPIPVKTDKEIAADNRTESLLRRSRSKVGTILTGFDGILSSNNQDDATKKTLLGE